MYGYIYETTNLINGKRYIGQHRAKKFDEKYKGSGQLISKAIKKYGFENFKCEIIEKCNSEQELNDKEAYWINIYDAVNNDNFYNLQTGGYKIKNIKLSNESKQKISNTRKQKGLGVGVNNPRYNTKIIHKNNIQLIIKKDELDKYLERGYVLGYTDEIKSHYISKFKENNPFYGKGYLFEKENNPFYGKNHSEESKIKMSKTIKEHFKNNGHPWSGKHHSEESKIKMKKSAVGKHSGDKNYMYGKTGNLSPTYGSKWMNNGIHCSKIQADKIDTYIDAGWVFGRLNKEKFITKRAKEMNKL